MMDPVRATFLFAISLCLAGCSGEPQEAQSPPPGIPSASRSSTQSEDRRPVIVAFGNSLTAGYGVDAGKSYPDFLQQLVDEEGYRYRIVNAGLSGDTTGGGVGRLESVLALKPEIVILELGANDGLRGLPVASTRANLEEMIARLKAAGAEVVLAGMTLPRNYGAEYIRAFEAMFTDLARQETLPLIPFLLAGVAETGEHMQADRLHPTVEGNRRVAANVMRVLSPLLRKAHQPAP
jgi:acyl-CoA thioesterase I